MSPLKLLILLLLLLGSESALCQNSYVLVDSLSQKTVNYAHIYSIETGIGTISNELGEFEIPSGVSMSDTLVISHISYKKKRVPLKSLSTNQTCHLVPDIVLLDEVTVFDQSVEAIVQDLTKTLKESTVQYGKAFYRQTTFRDTLATEWIEAFYDVAYSRNGIGQVHLNQARFARKKYDSSYLFLSHTNFSILSVGTQLYSPASNQPGQARAGKPFSEDFMSAYDFSIDRVYQKEGDTFLVINYEPGNTIKSPVNSYGNFVYNKTRKKLIQHNAILDHALGSDEISYKGKKTVKIENPKHTFQLNFSELTGNIEFIHVKYSYDFVQNEEVFHSGVSSTFIVYEKVEKPHKKLRQPTLMTEQVSNFEDAKYRPSFWKDNPIIRRTPQEDAIITSFEERNAFGSYFKRRN